MSIHIREAVRFETIPEMRARHRAELGAAVLRMSETGLQQKIAAKLLGVTPQGLNELIRREGIAWPGSKHAWKGTN